MGTTELEVDSTGSNEHSEELMEASFLARGWLNFCGCFYYKCLYVVFEGIKIIFRAHILVNIYNSISITTLSKLISFSLVTLQIEIYELEFMPCP